MNDLQLPRRMVSSSRVQTACVLIAGFLFPFWFIHLPGLNLGPGDIILMAALTLTVLQTGTIQLSPTRTTAIGTLLFLGVAGLSLFWSPHSFEGLKQFLQYGLIFVAVVPTLLQTLQDRRTRWHLFLGLWAIISAVTVASVFVAAVTSPDLQHYGFIWGNQNPHYWIVASGVILNLFLMIQTGVPRYGRVLCGLLAGLGLALVFPGMTLSAILQVVIGIWLFITWWIVRAEKSALLIAHLGLTVLAGIGGLVVITMYWETVYREGALYSRIPMYLGAFTVGIQAFPFGAGLSSSPVALDFLPSNIPRVTHNFILHYWVEIGVLGLSGFLLIVSDWLREVFGSVFRSPEEWNAFEVGIVVIFAAYLVVAFFQPPPVRRFWWLMFAFGWAALLDKTTPDGVDSERPAVSD